MHQQTKWLVVQIIACLLMPNDYVNQCWIKINCTQMSLKFESNNQNFLSRKYIWKCSLQNGSHFYLSLHVLNHWPAESWCLLYNYYAVFLIIYYNETTRIVSCGVMTNFSSHQVFSWLKCFNVTFGTHKSVTSYAILINLRPFSVLVWYAWW